MALIPPLCKLREFSKFVVVFVVENQADLIVGLVKASDHARVIEDLGSPFN